MTSRSGGASESTFHQRVIKIRKLFEHVKARFGFTLGQISWDLDDLRRLTAFVAIGALKCEIDEAGDLVILPYR